MTYTNGIERYVSKVCGTNPNRLGVPYQTGPAMMVSANTCRLQILQEMVEKCFW